MIGRLERISRDLRGLVEDLAISSETPRIIYLAVPITGGPALWRVARRHEIRDLGSVCKRFPDEFESEVVSPNTSAAKRLASQARKLFPAAFIVNPALVKRPNWSQEQYRRVWKDFLSRFADGIVASNGWSYSHGCVAEVRYGMTIGIPIFRPSSRVLSRSEIEIELQRRRAEARRYGLKAPFLFVGYSLVGKRKHRAVPFKNRLVA